jgi:hypothetical protein
MKFLTAFTPVTAMHLHTTVVYHTLDTFMMQTLPSHECRDAFALIAGFVALRIKFYSLQIRFISSRASKSMTVVFTRGLVSESWSLVGAEACVIGGPPRIVVYVSSFSDTYSFFSISGTTSVSNCT